MSDGMNKAILIGNLGRDPLLRYTRNGQAKLSVRIATKETFRNRENEMQERTEWHNVIIWGKRGEALNQLLAKGDRIGVEGRIQTRKYEDNEGQKRYFTEVVAVNVLLLNGKHSQQTEMLSTIPSTESLLSGDNMQEDNIPF